MSRQSGFKLVQMKGHYGKEDIYEADSLAEIRKFIEHKESRKVASDGD